MKRRFIATVVTPSELRAIRSLMRQEDFTNTAEFLRYCINETFELFGRKRKPINVYQSKGTPAGTRRGPYRKRSKA